MKDTNSVTVFGASGHTGKFVLSELQKREISPILAGRDLSKLNEAARAQPDATIRLASVDDPVSLDNALLGASAVINCAGPFVDTADAVIGAALRAGIHYIDVTAEQPIALKTFEQFSDAARNANIVIMPAMAFYGGLADLLATAAMSDWDSADEISIAVALDRWWPTQGTRLTGQRNVGKRFVFSTNRLEYLANQPQKREWDFPAPFGKLDVVELPLAEIITISSHLRTSEIRSYMNLAPIADIHDPNTPAPMSSDESGRSEQIFVMDVIVRKGNEKRRATARGQDIYWITAPIVVEAVKRIIDGQFKTVGVSAAGKIFDAGNFLRTLPLEYF